jgi:hypothetical protein
MRGFENIFLGPFFDTLILYSILACGYAGMARKKSVEDSA